MNNINQPYFVHKIDFKPVVHSSDHAKQPVFMIFHRDHLCFILFFLISGLPIQVRDNALSIKDEMPKSDVNKEYYTQNIDREVSVSCPA